MATGEAPVVVLGAGYAGVKLVQELSRRSGGGAPIVLVDRHPVHVVRTELYELGRLAEQGSDVRKWAIPIARVVGRRGVTYREGTVEAVDLARSIVTVSGEEQPYSGLALCLGNVPAYYGVPGAESLFQVYRLSGAMRLARALHAAETASPGLPAGARVRVVVVGGGATGVEVAAEIATADWRRLAGPSARPPSVTLVCGALPILTGLSDGLIEHARRMLHESGVVVDEGRNVTRVDGSEMTLADGGHLTFDIGIWAAGVEASPLVRALPVPHGRGGRLAVGPTLQLPEHPTAFGVGDVVELRDPRTQAIVPQTAQAAVSEAKAAADNLWRQRNGLPLVPFVFRERGMFVSLGRRKAAGNLSRVTVWGSPAALLKSLVEAEYRAGAESGTGVP